MVLPLVEVDLTERAGWDFLNHLLSDDLGSPPLLLLVGEVGASIAASPQ
jgi:hypothetical protein